MPRLDEAYDVHAGAVTAQVVYQGEREVWRQAKVYKWTTQMNPPNGQGQWNQFALVCQVNRLDDDGQDIEADMWGLTDVPVTLESDVMKQDVILSLIDYAGNGHIRLNGAGWDFTHTFAGTLRMTDRRRP